MINFEEYWNNRYIEGGKIWGGKPSKSAEIALRYLAYDLDCWWLND